MKKFIINLFLSAFCLYLLSLMFSGIYFKDFGTAVVAAFVFGLVNAVIKPIIFILSLPLTLLTLGLFSLVINALMLSLTSAFVGGFSIHGFGTAFIASIVLSLLNMLFISKD